MALPWMKATNRRMSPEESVATFLKLVGDDLWRKYFLVFPLVPWDCSAVSDTVQIALFVAEVTANQRTDNKELLNERLQTKAGREQQLRPNAEHLLLLNIVSCLSLVSGTIVLYSFHQIGQLLVQLCPCSAVLTGSCQSMESQRWQLGGSKKTPVNPINNGR